LDPGEPTGDGASLELDQHILDIIHEECQRSGIRSYNAKGVHWSWLPIRNLSFETQPEMADGKVVLFQGLQSQLRIDDWKPLLIYSMIRMQERKRNPARIFLGLFIPIVSLLIALPLLFTSKFQITNGNGVVTSTTTLGSILDLAVGLPLFFVGAAIANIFWRKQRIAADDQVVRLIGPSSLIESLKMLETYVSKAGSDENLKRLNQLANQEIQTTALSKYKISIQGQKSSLSYALAEIRKRIRTLERTE
jgi:hypothetical protein